MNVNYPLETAKSQIYYPNLKLRC